VPRVTVPVQDGAGVPNLPTAVALALGNEDPPPLHLCTVLAQTPNDPFAKAKAFLAALTSTAVTSTAVTYSDKGDFMGRIWGYPDMGLGEPKIAPTLSPRP